MASILGRTARRFRGIVTVTAVASAATTIAGACAEWPLAEDDAAARAGLDEEVTGEVGNGEAVYEVMGVRGRKMRVLFQATSGNPGDLLQLRLEGATTGYELAATTSVGDAPTLSGQATPWFVFPGSVPYLVRVRGVGNDRPVPFRFRFATASRTIEVGDTLTGAIMSLPEGPDVDEFRFAASAGQRLGVHLSVWGQPSPVRLELFDGQDALIALQDGSSTGGGMYSSAYRFEAPSSGEYRIRVAGVADFGVDPGTGPYRLGLLEVVSAPESTPEVIAPGGVLNEEAIDYPGDVDEFRIAGRPGDEVSVILRTLPWIQGVHYVDGVPQHPGGGPIIRVVRRDGGTIAQAGRATQRIVLSAGDEYTVRVEDPDPRSLFTGAYNLELRAIDRGVEAGDSLLRPGEWMSGAIEEIGDIDTFIFRGSPGQEVAVFGRRDEVLPIEVVNLDESVAVPIPEGTYDCLVRYSCGGVVHTIPTSGEYRLTARHVINEGGTLLGTGGYELLVNPVNRSPETAPILLNLREPVETEHYSPAGDIDEFEFDVSGGTHLRLVLESPRPLQMEVEDMATDSTLVVTSSASFSESFSPRVDGRYRVRISAHPPSPNQYDSIHWVPSEPVPYRLELRCALAPPWETPDCSAPE